MSRTSSGRVEGPRYQSLNRRTVATIQKEVVKRGSGPPSFHAKNDKEMIAAWGRDLDRILLIFNVRPVGLVERLLRAPLQMELSINNHTILLDIRRDVQAGQGGTDAQRQSVSTTFCSSTTKH